MEETKYSYGTPTFLMYPNNAGVVCFGFKSGGITGVLVPMFTCLEEAEKFKFSHPECAEMGFFGSTPDGTEHLLTKLKSEGVTHVNANNRNELPQPIDEIIAHFRNRDSW
jgi:hypothetical protein